MLQLLAPDFIHIDERGKLVQLCKSGYKQINVLYNKAGIIRGEHYHKICKEAFFVVNGSVKICLYNNNESKEYKFSNGDFFVIEPQTIHSLFFPEDCILIALYDKAVELECGGKDIYGVSI